MCLLLNAGADVNIKNFANQTPLDLLCELPLDRQSKSAMRLLLQHPSLANIPEKLSQEMIPELPRRLTDPFAKSDQANEEKKVDVNSTAT